MNWMYQGKELTEVPEGAHSFIYKIEIAGMVYIGKKNFWTTKKRYFGKKELAEITDRRKKTYEYVTKESNWRQYCSSSDTIKNLIASGYVPVRTILKICYSAKQATYEENKFLYMYFEDANNINDNISGTIFKQEVIKWSEL